MLPDGVFSLMSKCINMYDKSTPPPAYDIEASWWRVGMRCKSRKQVTGVAQTTSTAGTKGMWAIELLRWKKRGGGDDRLLFNSISCYVRGVHLAAHDL